MNIEALKDALKLENQLAKMSIPERTALVAFLKEAEGSDLRAAMRVVGRFRKLDPEERGPFVEALEAVIRG